MIRLPQCAECGKIKCMASSGDCIIKHVGQHTSGNIIHRTTVFPKLFGL